MPIVERFGVSMEKELLRNFDALIAARGYTSRSEALRDLVREQLVAAKWAEPDTEVVGTVTIVYDHDAHELAHVLTDLQHSYHDCIICSTHIHMDEHNCLEVVIVRGTVNQVTQIANALISVRGVKHGKLVSAATSLP